MICRICKENLVASYFVQKNNKSERTHIFYCKSCDAFFLDKESVNYDNDDLINYYVCHSSHIKNRYDLMFSCIENIINPSSFLDIGSGMGYSLEVAANRGWSAVGFEPNSVLAENCVQRGLTVYNRYFTGEDNGKYNLILLDNVLEHVSDPVRFVLDASRLLGEGGLLVIAVPPVDWLRKLLCSMSMIRNTIRKPQINIFYDVDQHISFFSRKAIGQIAKYVKMNVLSVRHHHSKFYNNYFSRLIGINDGVFFLRRI